MTIRKTADLYLFYSQLNPQTTKQRMCSLKKDKRKEEICFWN